MSTSSDRTLTTASKPDLSLPHVTQSCLWADGALLVILRCRGWSFTFHALPGGHGSDRAENRNKKRHVPRGEPGKAHVSETSAAHAGAANGWQPPPYRTGQPEAVTGVMAAKNGPQVSRTMPPSEM